MNYLIDKILVALEAELKDKVQYYVYGRPKTEVTWPKVMLQKGVIAVYPIDSNTSITSTNRDETVYSIGIELVKNVQLLVYQNMQVINDRELIEIVEDFDTTTSPGTLKSDTIRSILRRNYNAIGEKMDMNVAYNSEIRDNVALAQATITLTITDLLTQNYG